MNTGHGQATRCVSVTGGRNCTTSTQGGHRFHFVVDVQSFPVHSPRIDSHASRSHPRSRQPIFTAVIIAYAAAKALQLIVEKQVEFADFYSAFIFIRHKMVSA